eukprot:scaffold27695_cov64-Phaeocystis_antarctica.AAC.7
MNSQATCSSTNPNPNSNPNPSSSPNPNPNRNPNPDQATCSSTTSTCAAAVRYATQASNPRLADRVPGRSATHTCEPRLGQTDADLAKYRVDPNVEPPRLLAMENASGEWEVSKDFNANPSTLTQC